MEVIFSQKIHDVLTHLYVIVLTILNVAPASSSVDLSEVYKYTDLLCVNETEVRGISISLHIFNHHITPQAETLLGCSHLEDIAAAKSAVTQFYQKHGLSGCVLLTLGSQGLVYAADATSPVKHLPAAMIRAVDTTVSIFTHPPCDRVVATLFNIGGRRCIHRSVGILSCLL